MHDKYLYYDRWWIDNNDLNQVASSGFSLSIVGTIYMSSYIKYLPNVGMLSLTGS